MKRITFILVSLLALSAGSSLFAMGAAEPPPPLPGATTGTRFEIQLEPGIHYAKEVNYVFYRYTVWPQVAVWIEKPDGTFIETLYVTQVIVDQKFDAAPANGRPEALPIWTHLPKNAGGLDAVTSPTTVGSTVEFGNDLASRLPPGDYVVKLETNRSYDWNQRYTERTTGVNGQPSLLYRANVTVGGPDQTVDFVPISVGSVDGSDGSVNPDLSGIDTAYELFASMRLIYHSK